MQPKKINKFCDIWIKLLVHKKKKNHTKHADILALRPQHHLPSFKERHIGNPHFSWVHSADGKNMDYLNKILPLLVKVNKLLEKQISH